MKALFILFIFLLAMELSSQPFYTVVSSNGTTKIANSIDSALSLANNGDIIYAPAGLYNVNNIIINKSVHIIGARYNYAFSGTEFVTYWNGDIYFESGASGGSLQGIYFNGSIFFGKNAPAEVNNFTISRCLVNGSFYSGPGGWNSQNSYSNLTINECIFFGSLNLGYAKSVTVKKCILKPAYHIINYGNNVRMSNCLLICPTTPNDAGFNYLKNVIFENNIFTRRFRHTSNEATGIQYLNNIYCFETQEFPTRGVTRNEGNVSMQLESVLINYDNSEIDFTKHDFHLKPYAISLIKGTDGTQVGIYGTNEPFKDYGLPINPQIKKAKVSSITNPEGKLKIEFEVEAQEK